MSTINSPLLSPELLVQLEKLELVSRKVFRGRMKGERRSRRKGQSVEFADFRNYVPGDDLRFIDWNTVRAARQAVSQVVPGRRGPALLHVDRRQRLDGLRRSDQVAIRQATGGRAGLYRPGPLRPREDRNRRPAGPARRSRLPRPPQLMADAGLPGRHSTGRKRLAGPRREELLPPQLGQGHRRADQRLDGQARLRGGAALSGGSARWTST